MRIPDSVREFCSKIGKSGGKKRSKKKAEAARRNFEKARKRRWTKK